MTREEKQKAIDALKKSVPIMAVTQEEFKDYIQTLNKIMDWLEQETVSREVYEHEYFLRKEFELKIDKLQRQLDKIRKQIKSDLRGVEITLEVLVENDPLRPKMEGAKDTLENCLEIIDKAESEKQE